MLSINDINKSFITDIGTVKKVFQNLSLKIENGDFVSVIGSNGAGKSTLLDSISGNLTLDSGSIDIDGMEITNIPRHKRGGFISKVYQNPSSGTAPSMTVFENLSMADNKGKRFGFSSGLNRKRKEYYKQILGELGLGMENQLDTEVGALSGGQRQCLALIMATLNSPDILLLDEHTAALDPVTSEIIMEKTKDIVEKNRILTLMITHNLQDAIKYGNRLIMLHNGSVIFDIKGEDKKKLTTEKLLKIFNNRDLYLKDSDLFSA